MAFSDVFLYVLSHMTSVADVGNVYDHEPLIDDPQKYVAQFAVHDADNDDDYLAGWTMTRGTSTARHDGGDESEPEISHTYLRRHEIILRGFRSMLPDRNSEQEFRDVVEAILEKFDADPDLGGNVQTTDPIEEPISEARFFGDILVHYSELRLGFYVRKDRV